jgi:hypothetical protein
MYTSRRSLPRFDARLGATLIETTIVLTLAGLTAMVSIPRAQRVIAATNVRSARTLVATYIDKAHFTSIARGGGAAINLTADGRIWVTAPKVSGAGLDTIGRIEQLQTRYGVTLQMASDSTQIAYDALGIGTTGSSLTIGIVGSSHTDTLAVSASGRAAQ